MNGEQEFFVSSHAKEIKNLSAILNIIEITTFFMIRVTLDGEYFILCNSHDVLRFFNQENDIGDYFSCLAENSIHRKLSINLWPDYGSDESLTKLNGLNICHGLSITYRLCDYIDIFSFATDADNEKIKIFYLNNFQLLKRFIIYFKIKGKLIIEQQVYNALNHSKRSLNFKNDSKNEWADRVKKFQEEMLWHVVISKHGKKVMLTQKESEYLAHLLEGKSSRKIAEELGVSQRTIEACLENIKFKTGYHTKMQLLSVFLEQYTYLPDIYL